VDWEDGSPDHVIAYTDADLSTHLGQLGLLIDPIVRGGRDAAIDSEAASITPEFDPYLGMLKSIAAMYRRYLPCEPGAEEVAGLVERAVVAEDVFG